MGAVQIPNHAHCKVCGKAISFGDETCSKKCEEHITQLQKKRKQTLLFFYAAIGAFFLLLILQLTGILPS